MIIVVMSVLAITAFAKERTTIEYTDVNGVTHTVPIVKNENATASEVASKLGNGETMQALFMDNSSYAILKANDGTLTAFPSWYIIEPSGSNASYVAVSEIEYGYVNSISKEKTYDKGAIVYIEFPYGMTEVRSNNVFTSYESNVTDVYIPATVISIGTKNSGNASPFNGHKALKRVYIAENSQITDIRSGSFSGSTIEYFQFENLTNLVSIDGFTGCTNLSCDINLGNSKLVTLSQSVFKGDSSIKKITLPDTVETIGTEAFSGCTSATLVGNLPTSVKTIGNNAFHNLSGFFSDDLDFSKLTSLESIGGYAFNGCTSITGSIVITNANFTSIGESAFRATGINGELDLSRTAVTSIGNYAFYSTGVTKISLPDTLQTIGNDCFNGCSNAYFASDRLPSSLTSIGTYFMSGSKKINNTLIFPVGVTTVPSEFFNSTTTPNASGTLTLVFLGKMTNMQMNGSSYAGWAEKTVVYLAQNTISDFNGSIYPFTDKETGSLGSSTSQSGNLTMKPSNSSPSSTSQVLSNHMVLYFCGQNGKVETSYMLTPNGTNITEDRGTFVMDGHTHYTATKESCSGASCIVCDSMQYAPHEKGTLVSITYPNGFANDGCINYMCLVCENEYADGTADAIFIPHGYAYKLNGSSEGISAKFEINKEARDLFESVNECELHYGIIVANKDHFADGAYIENGKLNTTNQKGLQVEIIDEDFAFFSCLIGGFESGKYSSLELVMSGYAYTSSGEEKSEPTYFQKQYVQDNDEATVDIPYISTITRNGVTLSAVTFPQVKTYHQYVETKK